MTLARLRQIGNKFEMRQRYNAAKQEEQQNYAGKIQINLHLDR